MLTSAETAQNIYLKRLSDGAIVQARESIEADLIRANLKSKAGTCIQRTLPSPVSDLDTAVYQSMIKAGYVVELTDNPDATYTYRIGLPGGFTNTTILEPTIQESLIVDSLDGGGNPNVITLNNRFKKITSVVLTPHSITPVIPTITNILDGAGASSKFTICAFSDFSSTIILKPVSCLVTGIPADASLTDWGMARNSASPSATSTFSGLPASNIALGQRTGYSGGLNLYWNSAGAPPDTVTAGMATAKYITKIIVVTVQDAYLAPVEPDFNLTGTLYNLTAYSIEVKISGSWVALPGGSVTGDNKIMRAFTVNKVIEDARVVISATNGTYSRIVALEVWGPT
jgi:hypothetical protein